MFLNTSFPAPDDEEDAAELEELELLEELEALSFFTNSLIGVETSASLTDLGGADDAGEDEEEATADEEPERLIVIEMHLLFFKNETVFHFYRRQTERSVRYLRSQITEFKFSKSKNNFFIIF